jgi:hypothetical protein
MTEATRSKSDWPLAAACIGLSGFGLSAVPFIGTRYGDWPEATALGIGALPLIYLAVHMAVRFNERLKSIEARLDRIEGARK